MNRAKKVELARLIQGTIDTYLGDVDKEAAESRKADRKSRKSGIKKPGDGWEETYEVIVKHEGTQYGRNATVSISGCARYFVVTQNSMRPMFKQWNRSLKSKPQWQVNMFEPTESGNSTHRIALPDVSEDFNSLLQQVIVAMLGHAYYEASL